MNPAEIREEIKRNFHLFWDNFPFPVMLVYKDRTIIDANNAGQALGCPVGSRCADLGEKRFHAACKANVALKEQKGIREVGYHAHLGQVLDSYWIPLAGADDLYVHFGIDITEYAAARMLPGGSGSE